MTKRASLLTGTLSIDESEILVEADSGAANGVASESVQINNSSTGESKKMIDPLDDHPSEMTYGRRIALKLMKYSWYFPPPKKESEAKEVGSEESKELTEEDPTSRIADDFEEDISFDKADLKKGWAFFEHQTLYRYSVGEGKDKQELSTLKSFLRMMLKHKDKIYNKAQPGELYKPTKLYPLTVPHNQLGDFGLGIGLYFSNLRALILVTLVCGFISIYNILYYASSTYDAKNAMEKLWFKTFTLAGSAICSDTEWVPCPDCTCTGFPMTAPSLALPYNRCAFAVDDETGETLKFALKNNCDDINYGLVATSCATVLCMFVSVMVMGYFMKEEEIKFDEDEQTCQDYSIQIKNPPEDAKDPEEWRTYFKDNFDAQVRVCTCAVENDLLVKSLVQRRETIRSIHRLQPGKSMEMLALAKTAADIRRKRSFMQSIIAKVVPGIPEHYDKLVSVKGLVEGLAQLEYHVKNVFVTFETEEDQRKVLTALSVGYNNAKKKNVDALDDPKYVFKGKVLDVCEPEEPNTIRWQDLNSSLITRLKQQVWTFLYTLVLLATTFVIVFFVNQKNDLWASYTISLFNSLFPQVARFMVEHLETHQSQSQHQTSLYIKLVLFRWTTSALIFFIIIPFTDMITYGQNGLLEKIHNQFFSDLVTSNGLALLDIMGHLNRHFLAPRASTQDSMNLLFQGTHYDIAERYTDMTKILFMCVVYSSIYPMTFFLSAMSLTLKYFVDRFTLMRSWKRASAIGRKISNISRTYFITLSIAVMAGTTSYFWTGFPFDNLCEIENSSGASSYPTGIFTVNPYEGVRNRTSSSESRTAIVDPLSSEYRVCSQNFLGNLPQVSFPFVPGAANGVDNLDPKAYMSDGQFYSTAYFGWVALGLIILIILKFFWIWFKQYQKVYKGGYKSVGESQEIPFSETDPKSAFIPLVRSPVFAFPLIACRIDDIDEDLFEFNDPGRSYAYYDLTKDAKKLIGGCGKEETFTVVKSWPAESERTNREEAVINNKIEEETVEFISKSD